MDDYKKLSRDAKQAWQRGYDLAHPRYMTAAPERHDDETPSSRLAAVSHAVDMVGSALENLGNRACESAVAVSSGSGSGVQLVVMDPVSVEAVIDELSNMNTDECRKALGDGFLRGMIAKARAARSEGSDGKPPAMN